jgi:gliding motility-associated-like protein
MPWVLKTASKPQINAPQNIYSCDLGDGYANFDMTGLETEIIGNQSGLKIIYFDIGGNELPSPLPTTFQNTQPWTQTINVRVENELNNLCFSETSLDLIVNELPMANIEQTYFLCDLEPFLNLSIENKFDTYQWQYSDGSTISISNTVNLEQAGNYRLIIGENKNGLYCENSFDFELIRSQLPTITNIEKRELSDENYIEVFATGDGDFEYSIDGANYQNSNLFSNVLGGIYMVTVRDKFGCGEDIRKIILIDYPKYFTPNGDGINDYWQIKGINGFSEAVIFIYDRYGKLLKQINPNSLGWDGTLNGKNMISSDYWFTADLGQNNKFSGHFSLKR